MIKARRYRVIVLLSVALAVLGLPVLRAGDAEAAPNYVHGQRLSAPQMQASDLVGRARDYAMNTSGSVMNYAKMRTSFAAAPNSVEASWRRQMAAGARQAGTRITNISAAENAEVEKVRRWAYPCRVCKVEASHPVAAESPLSEAQRVACTNGRGVTKYVRHATLLARKWRYSSYLNSCSTNVLIAQQATCLVIAGAVSALAVVPGGQPVGAAAGLAAAVCTVDITWLIVARDNSRYGAIIIRYTDWRNSPKSGAVRDCGYYPQ